MPPFRRTAHSLRSAATFTGARPAYAAGVRASLATVLPLIAAHVLGSPEAGSWMSMGGFNGALSDRGGSYWTRARTMLAVIAAASLTAILGSLVGGHLVPALLMTFAVAFLASVLRVWGNPGVSIGGAALSVYVIALALPADHLAHALVRAAWIIAGGAWAMAIALVLWPLRPYRPARLAISACYSALANYVDAVGVSVATRHTAEWPVQHTPAVITSVRAALEHARDVLVQLRRGRPGAVDRGERLLVLSELADQMFGHVVALGETLATLTGTARSEELHDHCTSLLRDIAATARAIAAGVLVEDDASPIEIPWSGESLRQLMRAGSESVDPQYEHAAMILDRSAQFAGIAAVSVQALNGGTVSGQPSGSTQVARASAAEEVKEEHPLWDSFRAMLSPGSLIVRFALRVAVITTFAVALSELLELKRGYWMTLTVIVILQPYVGVTTTRAVQRVLGTVLGGLLAAFLGAWFHGPVAILVIATVFVACCVSLLPLNYAAFSVFLTPTFVLLAEASIGDWSLAGIRVENTILGGALALFGARFLWPSPERARFPAYAAAALRANAKYLDVVVRCYDDRSHRAGEEMRDARRATGLATVNAEESLQRALTEAHGNAKALAPALTVLAYIRRFTASVAALAVGRHLADGTRGRGLESFRDATMPLLEDLARALESGTGIGPFSGLDDLGSTPDVSAAVRPRIARLARQAATLHDSVAKLASGGG